MAERTDDMLMLTALSDNHSMVSDNLSDRSHRHSTSRHSPAPPPHSGRPTIDPLVGVFATWAMLALFGMIFLSVVL